MFNEIIEEEIYENLNFISDIGIEYHDTLDDIKILNNKGLYSKSYFGIKLTKVFIDKHGNHILVGNTDDVTGRFREKIKDNVENCIIIKLDKKFNIIDYNIFVLVMNYKKNITKRIFFFDISEDK